MKRVMLVCAIILTLLARHSQAQWTPTTYQANAAFNVDITKSLANTYILDHLESSLPFTSEGTLIGQIPYSITINIPSVDFIDNNIAFNWIIDYTVLNAGNSLVLNFNVPFNLSVSQDQLIAYINNAIEDLSQQIIQLLPQYIQGREELSIVIYNNLHYLMLPMYDTQFYDIIDNNMPGDFHILPVDYSFGIATSAQNGVARITPSITFEGYEPALRLISTGTQVFLSCSDPFTVLEYTIHNVYGGEEYRFVGNLQFQGNFSDNYHVEIGEISNIMLFHRIVCRVLNRYIFMNVQYQRFAPFYEYQTANEN